MRDEHLIYTEYGDKLKVVPEQGYKMLCTLTKAYLCEAIITEKEVKYFISEQEV